MRDHGFHWMVRNDELIFYRESYKTMMVTLQWATVACFTRGSGRSSVIYNVAFEQLHYLSSSMFSLRFMVTRTVNFCPLDKAQTSCFGRKPGRNGENPITRQMEAAIPFRLVNSPRVLPWFSFPTSMWSSVMKMLSPVWLFPCLVLGY